MTHRRPTAVPEKTHLRSKDPSQRVQPVPTMKKTQGDTGFRDIGDDWSRRWWLRSRGSPGLGLPFPYVTVSRWFRTDTGSVNDETLNKRVNIISCH